MVEMFPVEWMVPEALPWVRPFIRNLPIGRKEKKRGLQEWAEGAAVELTADDIEKVTELPAGEI